ncbi:MAG TPA: dihydroorotase [Thermomicrobiales bacterium]|nr:dihydroorotase [Thermomicrobiales bacterium]
MRTDFPVSKFSGSITIRNGRVVDAATGLDGRVDLLLENGRVALAGDVPPGSGDSEIDATGLIVTPGLIDMHVHLRQPGFDTKETVATGTAAAAAGGFTTICCMPNTRPTLDSRESIELLDAKIAAEAIVNVRPIAAISVGRLGVMAVDYSAVAAAGAIGFSDDGDSCDDTGIMIAALEASKELNRPVMVHCEDKNLMGGSMHEGAVSARLGFKGLPALAEERYLARDLELAAKTGGWLYALHVSTGAGIELIRQAKASGVHVTAEAMPHHLLMTDEWVAGDRTFVNVDEPAGMIGAPADPNTKVNPPLRPHSDTELLLAAIEDGTFDIVATDHAPHAAADKVLGQFETASFGLSGLEFGLPMMLSLVRTGRLSLIDLVRLMSYEPARVLSSNRGRITVGAPADITIFDPDEVWVVDAKQLRTKSANTPLLGMTLRGRARYTIVNGEVRFAT